MLRLYHTHLKEFTEIQFRSNGRLLPQGIQQINFALRSRSDEAIQEIDLNLVDLLDHLQDYFAIDTVEIISGYRSPQLNQKLKRQGRGVAKNSHHIKGGAIDFHFDEIREETLRDYLQQLQLGGVGFYGTLDFIHIDTGPYRNWQDNGSGQKITRKLIGVLKKRAAVQLTSDSNEYLPGENAKFVWTYPSFFSLSKIKELRLQKFWRGEWQNCPNIKAAALKESQEFTLPSVELNCVADSSAQPYGKYRWVFKIYPQGVLYSSNEFYFKKR